MAEIELRTFVFLDSMQPQFASFVATTSRGYLPVEYQASLFVEVAPGIAINRVTDVALKKNDVQPGRAGRRARIRAARGPLGQPGRGDLGGRAHPRRASSSSENDRLKPKVMSSQIITNIDPYQAQLINRIRYGNMILGGDTLYILEVHPAGYATIAANEAEKASPISLIEMQMFGAYGRLYLGGTEARIAEAAAAVLNALERIEGRPNK